MDSQSLGQDGIPSDSGQSDDYAPQPVFQNPQHQTINRPDIDGHIETNTHPSNQKPIWNDDEDVVID